MEKDLNKHKYWLTLGRNVRFTAKYFFELYATNKPIEDLFHLSSTDLRKLGISDKCLQELVASREKFGSEQVLNELIKNHIEAILYFEPEYPESLKQIYDPPFILYKKGPADLNRVCIGVVGSRRLTDYGVQVTEKIAGDLAASGITVVSGLALGIDTIAAQAALNRGGTTIAVLGCGLNQIYPSSNVRLAQEIMGKGAIVTEYPFNASPAKYTFPMRNRIISGLSQGLLVTEAAEKSGSLITAASALDQNREVFAVPGNIFNLNSQGTNNLIKAGAHVVTSSQDILSEFGIMNTETLLSAKEIKGDSETERAIIGCLLPEPKHIDLIILETKLPQHDISAALTIMEISAKVKQLGGNVYRLNN